MIMTDKFALVSAFIALLICLPSVAADYVIEDPKSCTAIGGEWVNASEPDIGRCTLQRNLKLDSGDVLSIPVGITLIVTNAELNNAGGAIYVADHAVLRVYYGSLVNSGTIDVDDDGILRLSQGYIDNRALILSEGTIEIFSNTILYNTGTLRNYSGGDIISHGTILVYRDSGVCEINNETGGTITNRGELYLLDRCELNNDDTVINRSTGELLVSGVLSNRAGGVIENTGHIDGQSGQLTNDGGTITNKNGGQLWGYGTTRFDNKGSGTITNQANSLIRITAPAAMSNRDTALLHNEAMARIFVDDGELNNSSTLRNAGTIDNDLTNNINGGISGHIVNDGNGIVENEMSGTINNAFGIFENNATVNNAGAFWICFGNYQGSGIFTGNAIQSCTPTPNFPSPPTFP